MVAVFIILGIVAWMTPGAFIGRNLYAREVRKINAKPVTIIPPKPKRPEIKEDEMLHVSAPVKCSYLRFSDYSCNCKFRADWIKLKNDWIDYNEWIVKYGHIKDGVVNPPTVSMSKIYASVPLWPLALLVLFIQSGAPEKIDYDELARVERQLLDLGD